MYMYINICMYVSTGSGRVILKDDSKEEKTRLFSLSEKKDD